MKFRLTILLSLLVMFLGACSTIQNNKTSANTPNTRNEQFLEIASGKKIKVISISPWTMENGQKGLSMDYETEIKLNDSEALKKEAEEVWQRFRVDVEKGNFKTGMLVAKNYEGNEMSRHEVGRYAFAWDKQPDGSWKRLAAKQEE